MLSYTEAACVSVHDAQFVVRKRYSDLHPLAGGAYGLVASAADTAPDGLVKRVAIKKMPRAFKRHRAHTKRVLREIKLLRFFLLEARGRAQMCAVDAHRRPGHENNGGVIEVLDIFATPADTDAGGSLTTAPNCAQSAVPSSQFPLPSPCDMYIVTPLMDSDLERLIESKQQLTDRHIRFLAFQLLAAVSYLHSAGVLHRDLKPSNVLVNAKCQIRLCDFGLARAFVDSSESASDGSGGDTLADDTADPLTQYVVTRWYRAPELLTSCEQYGAPIDLWAAGCILAELICQRPVFRAKSVPAQLELIIATVGADHASDRAFISKPAAREAVTRLAMAHRRTGQEQGQGQAQNRLTKLLGDAGADSGASCLVKALLTFAPSKRATATSALDHSYLRSLGGSSAAPVASRKFLFELDSTGSEAGIDDREEANTQLRNEIAHEQRLIAAAHSATGPPSISSHSFGHAQQPKTAMCANLVAGGGANPMPHSLQVTALQMELRQLRTEMSALRAELPRLVAEAVSREVSAALRRLASH